MSAFILSQRLIGISICFGLMSFQFKHRKQILFCLFCCSVLIGSHFLLLEQYTAAGLMVISAVRTIASMYITSNKVMLIFLLLGTAVTFFTYSGLLSILSYIAASLSTIASFRKDDKHLRQIMMFATSFWLLNNYLASSPAAVLMEILFLSGNFFGYYRHYLKPKKFKNQ